jgi:hypothetical protein
MAQMCVASTAKGKNENYENLRAGKAPFILHSGAAISDAGSGFPKLGRDPPSLRRGTRLGEVPVATLRRAGASRAPRQSCEEGKTKPKQQRIVLPARDGE